MKQALLILMMMLLPWQTATATQRNLVHILSGGGEQMAVHLAQHEANVLHHHDHDDGNDDDDVLASEHQDSSARSMQHLNDLEHGGTLNLLLATPVELVSPLLPRTVPALSGVSYYTRSTHPPFRPPCLPA